MLRLFAIIVGIGIIPFLANSAFAQEIGLATFQETGQILIDKVISQNVTASITLQSTSNQEMQIPSELEEKIRNNERIIAIVLTNEENCVLGVFDQSCIMVNVSRLGTEKGIIEIQDSAKEVGAMFIDDLNQVFDTEAKLHSVFVHASDETNVALETSGVISGRGTVSVVYTMPLEDTSSMYEKISAILIPRVIRDSGGFYELAKNLSDEKNAKMTFSIIPMENSSLFQLKVSVDYPGKAADVKEVNPLEFLQANELKRSEYFSDGFYPLNSILQVVVLSPDPTTISNVRGNIIETQVIDGEKIPIDIRTAGWVFDPDEGERIQGKFIFGEKKSISKNELSFTLGSESNSIPSGVGFSDSLIIIIIIVAVAAVTISYYLKGYKKS